MRVFVFSFLFVLLVASISPRITNYIETQEASAAVLSARTIQKPSPPKRSRFPFRYLPTPTTVSSALQSISPTSSPTPTTKPTNTPSPTSTKTSPTNTPTPTLTSSVSHTNPTATIAPTQQPSVQIISTTESSVALTNNVFIDEINKFRSTNGKSPLQPNSDTCSFAKIRAGEITTNFNHDGFRQRIDSKTLPYPSYTSIAENIAMNSDATKVVQGWINSSGHKANLLKDVPYGCVESSGKYYVYEAWKP